MRIGVLYGEHGEELRAIDLGRSFEDCPVDGVEALPANEEAISLGERFIDENLSFALNHADAESEIYERRRAAEVLGWCVSREFDATFTLHASHYGFSYATAGVNTPQEMLLVAEYLGFEDVIIEDVGLPAEVNTAMALELVPDADPAFIKHWRRELASLAEYDSLEHLADDFSVGGEGIRLWSYQDVITADDQAHATQEYYEGRNFSALEQRDIQDMEIPLGRAGFRHPYTLNFGDHFLSQGLLGEYVYYIGRSRNSNWRSEAMKLSKRMERAG